MSFGKETSTPASRLIARFGAKTLAGWAGRHHSRVLAWAWPPERGGTGGVIPVRLRPKIMEGALKEQKVVLTAADFELAQGETYIERSAA